MSRSEGSCERNAMTFVSCSRVTLDGTTGDSEADQGAGHDTEGNAQRNRVRSLGRRRTTPNRRCIAGKSVGWNCSALHSASDRNHHHFSTQVFLLLLERVVEPMVNEEEKIRLIREYRTDLLDRMFDELSRNAPGCSTGDIPREIVAVAMR